MQLARLNGAKKVYLPAKKRGFEKKIKKIKKKFQPFLSLVVNGVKLGTNKIKVKGF